MREIICIFAALTLVFPAFATGDEQQLAINKAAVVAAVSYVDGAYSSMNSVKQDKLTSSNVVESGSGPIVSNVTASNGTVTVSKSEVTIPVGATTSDTRATIWLE